MTLSSQRTLYGVDLQLAMLLGEDYHCLPNTTLNEKFDILPGNTVPSGVYPKLKYITIGVGGDSIIPSSDNFIYSEHSPLDAGLFKHIPFVMKPIEEDFTVDERALYRFRVEKTVKDQLYACYYLKVIDNMLYDNKFYKVTTINGESYLKLFKIDDPIFLNPKPRNRSIDVNNLTSTEFVTKLARFKFELTPDELKELDNVYNLLDLDKKIISEIGLCSGIEENVGPVPEASCVQINFHIGVGMDLTYSLKEEESVIKYIELGGSEALIY